MTPVQTTQAVAADYADAILVARRAKNVLFLLLALVLLIQLGVFFVVKYVPAVNIRGESMIEPSATAKTPPSPATEPASSTTHPSTSQPATTKPAPAAPAPPTDQPAFKISYVPFEYIIAATDFLGILLSVSLAVILLLIIMMVLVGKPRNLVGVAPVTGAFCWSVLLVVFLFPWQALFSGKSTVSDVPVAQSGHVTPTMEAPDMKIPGVLYTFPELARDYDFDNRPLQYRILKWGRFVAFPALSLIILLLVQGGSSRGLRSAVGETEVTT